MTRKIAYKERHRVKDNVPQKKCRTCRRWKPETAFCVSKCHADSLHPQCRWCVRKVRIEHKIICFKHYGGIKCKSCGNIDIDVLTLDHINDDGVIKTRETSIQHVKYQYGHGGLAYYIWLIKKNFPSDHKLQVLCFNCNIKKRVRLAIKKIKETE